MTTRNQSSLDIEVGDYCVLSREGTRNPGTGVVTAIGLPYGQFEIEMSRGFKYWPFYRDSKWFTIVKAEEVAQFLEQLPVPLEEKNLRAIDDPLHQAVYFSLFSRR